MDAETAVLEEGQVRLVPDESGTYNAVLSGT